MKLNTCAVALLILFSLFISGCTGSSNGVPENQTQPPKAQWMNSPESNQQFGLGPKIEVWEDGYRSAELSDSYEWWYFDALLEDGTVVVAWVGHHWPPGAPGWRYVLDITPPGEKTIIKYQEAERPDYADRTRADIKLGKHLFQGNLETYRIVVDPESMDGFGIDLTLTRRTPSYRPAIGHFGDAEKYLAWLVAVPEGKVTGSLIMNNKARPVTGSGYHDHNWGNITPNKLISNWWWGRASVGPYTVVAAELRATPERGGGDHPVMLITSPQGELANLVGRQELDLVEDPAGPHPDPEHKQPIAAGVTFVDGRQPLRVHFGLSDKILTSANLLKLVSAPKRFMAGLVGASPWYTRVESPVELKMKNKTLHGHGTLEFMDFE